MRLPGPEARRRFAAARVVRLATADAAGMPHLVPMVFALVADTVDTVYSAVDAKPKRTTALRRLANVRANPRVALLADHYEDDWTALWWVRADGTGRILAGGEEFTRALDALTARYAQYRRQPPPGPVLAVDVASWTGWAFAPPGAIDDAP